jgi:hypothetical protein
MKIYKKGNYIYIVDNNGDIKQDHANEVKVTKSNVSNEKYTIYSDDLGLNEVEFSEIKKEDGNAYASVSAWELWYAENTGFNPAPGGSGAGTTIEVVPNFSSLPSASSNTDTFYWCENSQGTAWLPGTLGGTYYPSGLYYSNGTSWSSVTSPYNATQNEVNTGTNNDKFVTPYTFENASKWNDYTLLNLDFVFVNSKTDLPTAVSNVITLLDNVTYYFTSLVDLTGDRLVCGINTTILGASSENCIIKSTGLSSSTALITSVYSLPMRNITITHGTALNLDGDGVTTALDWFGVNFTDCAIVGTIKDYTNFVMSDSAFLNSGNLTFDGTIGTIGMSNCLFDLTPGSTGLILPNTLIVSRRFRVIYSSFVVLSGEAGINVNASATISSERYILDTVNFSGGGTYISGIGHTDNKALFVNCVGITNTSTKGFMYMLNNATDTTIGVPNVNVWVKANGTTVSGTNSKFTHTTNRLTYNGAFTNSFLVTINATLRSGGTNQLISIGVAKNGVAIDESEGIIRTTTSNIEHGGSTQAVLEMVSTDYVELYVRNTSSTNIRVTDFNFNIVKIPV